MASKARYVETIPAPRTAIDWRAMLTQAAFGLALAMTAARCMLLETIRDPFEISPGSTIIPRGPGADTSIILDLLCCLPALLVLLRRCVDKTYTLRGSWAQALLIPLVGWMWLSVRWADDKFATVVSASNFLAAMAMLWAMSQLVRSWLRLRLVAAVAFGLLMAFLVRGFYYKFLDMPMVLEQQSKLFQQQRLDPNSFAAKQLALKIRELVGFNDSPNSFAGLIILLMTIGLGAILQRIRERGDRTLAIALAAPIPLAIWLLIYTQSKAALVMPIIVVALLASLWKWHAVFARYSRRAFWIGLSAVVLGMLAVIGHGLVHHRLPTDSLNFRWRYWAASARMFWRHPIRGVGWDNFGIHYLRDRLPAASEEIRDPHNFVVRFFVELGAVGGILVLAWLMRLWWELTRPVTPPEPIYRPLKKLNHAELLFLGAIILASIVISISAGLDFGQSGYFITGELINHLLYLCAMLLGAVPLAIRTLQNPQVDTRPAPWILYGILVGLGVFLIHNLIEFSLFEPGPLCLFGILAGSALGMRLPNPPIRKPAISPVAIGAMGVAAVIWMMLCGSVAVPISRAEAAAHAGDEQLRAGHCENAERRYIYAAELLPINADYAYRAGRALHMTLGLPVPLTSPEQIDRAAQFKRRILSDYGMAIQRDPDFLAPYHFRAIFWLQMGNSEGLIADFEKVMELNPNEVSLRLEYARDLELLRLLPEAKKQFALALAYNEQLDKAEPKRLSVDNELQIKKEMESLPD